MKVAPPMLTVGRTPCVPSEPAIDDRSRSRITRASSGPTSWSNSANSSPPSRAERSWWARTATDMGPSVAPTPGSPCHAQRGALRSTPPVMPPPPSRRARWITTITAALGYAVAAVMLTWPLARHLTTTLLGDPTGDTGVYVWNLWIFQHELLSHGRLPFSTDHIFAETGGADFGLHNYTPLAGLIGAPFVQWLGAVGAFNVVVLTSLTTSAFALFLLGRQVGLRPVSAWAAGLLFIAAPLLTARETAHLSLITNAALPLFLWALLRTLNQPRLRDGVLIGGVVAMATYSDAYYAVYCVIMGLFLLAWRFLRIEFTRSVTASRSIRWIDAFCLLVATAVVAQVGSGVTTIVIGSVRVGMATLYTPVLLLVALVGLRTWLRWRPSPRFHDPEARLRALWGPGLLAITVCLALLSPLLVGLANRYAQGDLPDTGTYWRSSPRGVDLLAYVVPNSSHAWLGQWTKRWLLPDVPDAFPEFVAGFSLVALACIAVAAWRQQLPRMWMAFTAVFVLLSLGPFIHVGGVNTFVIGPWALLRYVPVIGMARSPSRFAIVAAMGLSLLFAFAMDAWRATGRKRWTLSAGVVAFLIALEVVPAPRTLYSAGVPEVYSLLTAPDEEADQGRLLELPAGIRDGVSSLGDFNASTQFFQTRHARRLIGGYLSRVSGRRKRESLEVPILAALYTLSKRPGPLADDVREAALASREAFVARSCITHVMVDTRRASNDLRAFAVEALGLVSIYKDDRSELLMPEHAPCVRH